MNLVFNCLVQISHGEIEKILKISCNKNKINLLSFNHVLERSVLLKRNGAGGEVVGIKQRQGFHAWCYC